MARRHKKGKNKLASIKYRKKQGNEELTSKQEQCPQGQLNLQFNALDTWFFRESRPHDAAGASELSSLFPPPIRTLLGAVRSFLGESIQINWKKFDKGINSHAIEGLDFEEAVGNSDNLGLLKVEGAWVCLNNERLYPTPCYLMHKDEELTRLKIGSIVYCDLGHVRLPELEKGKVGYKGFEKNWITANGLRALLEGKELPNKNEIKAIERLLENESRIGIARNNETRAVIEGRLYQTQHIRLKDNISIELDIKNIDEKLLEKLPLGKTEILRLGGEGRMAALTVKKDYPVLPFIKTNSKPLKKMIIHFISAADFNGKMFPEDFEKQDIDSQTVWKGELEGIKIIIEAAVIGKVHREGGWNMQKHQPRAVQSYIPAGSAWFCRLVDESLSSKKIIEALNGKCIGSDTEWGRGQILIGHWKDNNHNQGEANGNK